MCDSATLNLIDDVVAQKVNDGEMFTAFDVTLAVQENLKKNNLFDHNHHRHTHLKNDVHRSVDAAVSAGQYQRNLQNVGAPTPAFVYYPIGSDPSNYVPLTRKDAGLGQAVGPHTINIPAPIAAGALTNDNDGDGSDIGRKPDARGTICVPSFLLRSIGFNPNDTAYAVAGNDSNGSYLSVVRQVPSGDNPITTYTVDYHCNVRVTKSTLDYAGLKGQSYDFEVVNDKVIVREHTN